MDFISPLFCVPSIFIFYLKQKASFLQTFHPLLEYLICLETQQKESAAAGWIHYLAFDYFVGCWIVNHSIKKGIPYFVFISPLICTLFAGPFGLLLFLVLRFFYKRFAL